jgi:D-inositol-3-phosphate glycosyltransferase
VTPRGGRRRRLVAVGFTAAATGLNRVMARLLGELAPDFEVHWLGLGYRGPVRTGPVTLHPSNLVGGDVFGVQGARELVDGVGADVVLLYNDLWLVDKYRDAFAGLERPPRVVAYCPVDGRIVDSSVLNAVSWVDDLVVFVEFARGEIVDAGRRAGLAMPALHVIGHGVDDRPFEPVDRARARAAALPAGDGWGDAFVVLNANRLQPRKRIDVTVGAFARFAADRPDARLYLHHGVGIEGDDVALRDAIAASGVADRIHVSRDLLGDADLNLLYNACDVGVNTAMGEGWGLVSFEHALTGAAQVVPRHSACEELWTGAAEMVEPGPPEVPPFSLLEMRDTPVDGVADALARLHDDPRHLDATSAVARARATAPRYSWAHVGARWRELLHP